MKIAVMQPYFFPYLGYFQLIKSVDKFVVYDTIKYTKGGWINRNRFLKINAPDYFTLPLKSDSDYLDIVERKLSDDFEKSKIKIERQIMEAYKKAPYFDEVFEMLCQILDFQDKNLFNFIFNSIQTISHSLELSTDFKISSELEEKNELKFDDRVLSLVKSLGGKTYINPPGGMELYSEQKFKDSNVELRFLIPELKEYKQSDNSFVPNLSILDVLMWNGKHGTMNMLNDFKIVSKG